MPYHSREPEHYTSPGYPEGQRLLASTANITDVLLERVDFLERELVKLQQKFSQMDRHMSTPPPKISSVVNQSTQTDLFTDPQPPLINCEDLRSRICASQSQDKDIGMLIYFMNNDMEPVADEIKLFQPRMRRYLWQFSRFTIKNNLLYRKKFDSDRTTEIHQLVVPASQVKVVLQFTHPTLGHQSLADTVDMATRNFFWPYMHRDIVEYASACKLCQAAEHADNTQTDDVLPSHPVRSAVCAITRITRDFISSLKLSSNRRRSRNRRRPNKERSPSHNHQWTSSHSSMGPHHNSPYRQAHHHTSPPRDQHYSPVRNQYRYSPPRDGDIPHSPHSEYGRYPPSPRREREHFHYRDNDIHSPDRLRDCKFSWQRYLPT